MELMIKLDAIACDDGVDLLVPHNILSKDLGVLSEISLARSDVPTCCTEVWRYIKNTTLIHSIVSQLLYCASAIFSPGPHTMLFRLSFSSAAFCVHIPFEIFALRLLLLFQPPQVF